MANKFLGSGSSDLTNGTASLYIANLTVDNLEASQPIKTNTTKTLESTKLDIADVTNLQAELDGKLSNPMTSDLDFQNFSAVDIKDVEFNKVAPVGASNPGTLKLYANENDSEIHMVDESGTDTVIGGEILINLDSQSQGTTTFKGLIDIVESDFESVTENTNQPVDQSATLASHGFTFTVPAETAVYAVGININHIPTAGVRVFRIYQDSGEVLLASDTIGSADPVVNARYKHTLASPLVLAPGTYSLAIELNTNDFINQTNRSSELSPLFTGYTGASALTPLTFPNIKAPANAPHVGYLYFAQPPNEIGTIQAQDAIFDSCEVNGTLTTDVLISRESVETKDTLIHLGVDNVADTSNLGAYWEYNNAGKKYGGLVRSAGQKKVYLFKDETVKPTPSSNIINYPREDLVLNNLESKNTHAQNNVTVGDETDNGVTALLNTGFSQFSRYESVAGGVGFEKFKARGTQATPTAIVNNDVICTNIANGHDGTSFVQTGRDSYVANENFSAGNTGTRYELEITPDGTATKKKYLELTGAHLAIGDVAGSTDYKLPTTRGTLNQVLQTDASGVVSWANPANPFDQDLNTTDDVQFNSVGVEGWTISEDVAGDFSLTKGENKLIFGDHTSSIPSTLCIFDSRDSSSTGGFRTFRSRGILAAPTAIQDGDILDIRRSFPHDGTNYHDSASIRTVALGDHSATNSGTYVEIELTPQNSKSRNNYYKFKTNQFEVGTAGAGYVLPTTRGTLDQVLKTDGAGGVTWQDDAHSFDQDLNTTDSVSFASMTAGDADVNMTLDTSGVNVYKKYKNTVNGPTLETRRGRGTNAAKLPPLINDTLAEYVMRGYNGSGEVVSSAIVSRVTENWSFGNTGSRMEISITPTGTGLSVPFLDLKDNGLDIGNITAGTNYTLPTTRGTLNQVLKTDAFGVVTWQSDNPFDQPLNTTDFVEFNRALINGTGTSGSTDLTSIGLTIMTRASADTTGASHLTNKARGTRATPTAVASQDKLYELDARGYNGTIYKQSAGLRFKASEAFTGIANGTSLQVDITEVGDTTKKQYFELSDSGLAIGDSAGNTEYTLPAVRGTINQILKTDASGVVGWSENAPLESLSSGVLTGGVMTINVDDTKFDISDGTGQITQGAVKTPVSWSGLTSQSTAYAGILTYVCINSAGNPMYSPTKPSNSALRDNIFLGVLVHPNAVNLVAIDNEQLVLQNTTNQIHDLANAIGFINTSGNQLLPSGANLTFQKLAGTMFAFGSNYKNDVKNPHDVSTPLVDTAGAGTFQYRYQDGSSGPTTSTLIIPGEYDDGNGQGSPGAIGTNNWQVQRIYLFTAGNVIIQPGQAEYKDYADAIQGYETEAFVTEPSIAENGLLIGYLVVRGGGTNLNIAGDGVFINAGKFGSSTSGGIGGTTHAHGQQYFISNTGETVITLTDTYYDITGTRLDSELNEISAQAQSLTYTGSTMRTLKLETHFSWQGPSGASAENYRAAFFKNGSLIVPGQMTGALQTGGNYPRNMSSSVITTAVQNDIFTVKVKNVTATQNVVIKDFQFIISDI